MKENKVKEKTIDSKKKRSKSKDKSKESKEERKQRKEEKKAGKLAKKRPSSSLAPIEENQTVITMQSQDKQTTVSEIGETAVKKKKKHSNSDASSISSASLDTNVKFGEQDKLTPPGDAGVNVTLVTDEKANKPAKEKKKKHKSKKKHKHKKQSSSKK